MLILSQPWTRLGELQLAYIAFLLGQNADGFDQWRGLLQLLCSCEEAAQRRTELYAELLRAFFAQMSQAPSDLFGDDLTKDNFLGSCTLSLLEICEEASPKLRKRCGSLIAVQQHLTFFLNIQNNMCGNLRILLLC